MPRSIHAFDDPERFVAGTVGQPGERVFYLQVRDQGRLVSVAAEKGQVSALAERLDNLLDELRRKGVDEVEAAFAADPASHPFTDNAPLDSPVEEEFRVGALALGWDPQTERVVLEAQELSEEPSEPLSDEPEGPDVLRVRILPVAARAFAARARRVVAAGRPPCPLCGLPMDPEGHVCPRQNGHSRP